VSLISHMQYIAGLISTTTAFLIGQNWSHG